MVRPAAVLDLGRRVAVEASEKHVPFMAAGIAYNAFVSLAPLLVLLLVLVRVIGGGLEARTVALAEGTLPGPIAGVVRDVFAGGTASTSASVVGLVVLVWGTFKVFRGLDTAFGEIYETEGRSGLRSQVVDGAVVAAALAVAVLATVGVSTVFAAFGEGLPRLGLLTPAVLVVGLVAAFYPLYHRFPAPALGWREVLPGTLLAAMGWAALQAVFQVYLVFRGSGSESFFGGVIVVITWLYFSGLVLLLGAVLNAVVGGHASSADDEGRPVGEDADARRSIPWDAVGPYLRHLDRRIAGDRRSAATADRRARGGRAPDTGAGTTAALLEREAGPATGGDGVEVIERSRTDDDVRELTVTFRWRAGREGE